MAADSLFGGSTDLSGTLTGDSLDIINQFLTDTVGGSAITGAIGDSTILLASGDEGQKQGALLPSTSLINGTIDDGVLKLEINLPAHTGFVFEGLDNATANDAGAFLRGVIDSYLPPGTADHVRDSLNSAVDQLVASINALGVTNVVVRVVDIISGGSDTSGSSLRASGANEVVFNTTASGTDELLAFNLGRLNAGDTLVLQGVENAVIAGAGTVRVAGDSPIRITSDIADQNITGGGGNDTLIGGGGNDTLTGGAGNDVFAFSHLGHFSITDLGAGDKVAFEVPGVTTVAQLAALVTAVTETAQGVTFSFGPDASITLVGLSAADVTADMIKFTI